MVLTSDRLAREKTPVRAWRDAEQFRKESVVWFWGVEVTGGLAGGAVGGWMGSVLTPTDPTVSETYWYPAIGSTIGVLFGLLVAFLVILAWNLFRAPYRQRNELRQLLSTGSNEPSSDSILEQAAPLIELAIDRFLFEEDESSKGVAYRFGNIFGRYRARRNFTTTKDELRTLSYRCSGERRAVIERFIVEVDEVAYSEDFSKGYTEQREVATAAFDELKRQLGATA